ncbi:unnamed protein product [Oncorhynchus mykiss]|uniref:Uncharacterized protein n=1 Tax=Oncorhynchus mykiss TaxID=8022 RepID=A0A060ZH05_ONCMY|nr:unnamed protein product [Oncorhynchus mykiss]
MQNKNRDQGVKRNPNGEVPVGNLVDIDKTSVTKSLHRDSEREREKEGDGKAGGVGDANSGKDRGRKRDTEGARGEEEKRSCCSQKLKKVPQCHVELEQLSFSRTHNVLIDVNEFHHKRTLKPHSGRHVWHSDFVKMPCSPESLIKTGWVTSSERSRWEVVSKQLESLAKKTTASVGDVEKAIKKYNPKYEDQWSFDALHTFVQVSYHFTVNGQLALQIHLCCFQSGPQRSLPHCLYPLWVRGQTTTPHHCQTLPKTLLRAGLSNRPDPGILEGY